MYYEISNDAVPGDLALPLKNQYQHKQKQNLPIALVISFCSIESCSIDMLDSIKLVLLIEGEVCNTALYPYKKSKTNSTLAHITEFCD